MIRLYILMRSSDYFLLDTLCFQHTYYRRFSETPDTECILTDDSTIANGWRLSVHNYGAGRKSENFRDTNMGTQHII